MSIAGKILARVLLNRLNEHFEQPGLLPESQCGFRKNRGTIDMIFTARQLQEKCQEQNVDLYMTFVDPTKSSDTFSHEGLWKIMAKFGCPTKFIAMARQFHDGMIPTVQNDGEFIDPFSVINEFKQGCVLASTLFSLMFSATFTDSFQDGDHGIPIRYRFDGKLFNLRRLQAKSKVQTEVLDEFLLADDMAKGAPTEEKMQKGVDQVSDSCDSYDLTISIKKNEVVYQPAPGKPYSSYHHSERSTIARGSQFHLSWKHIVQSCAHWWWSQCQDCQSKCSFWLTTWKYLGSKWNKTLHKAERLHIRGAANTTICYIYYMRNLDSLPTVCQKTEPLPYKLSYKTSKYQVARQDSRHRSPEKGRDAMLQECLMNGYERKSSMENYKSENAPMMVRRSDTKTPSKPPLNTSSTCQQSHGNRLHRIEQSGLIRRCAGEYEAKRISEPEQKCAQRKARAKTSPTELSSSDLSCTVCNRQFELRLVSSAVSEHTNNNTSRIRLGLVIVSNDRRTNRGAENRGYHIYIEKVQTINARVIVVVVGWVGWCVRACVCVYMCVFSFWWFITMCAISGYILYRQSHVIPLGFAKFKVRLSITDYQYYTSIKYFSSYRFYFNSRFPGNEYSCVNAASETFRKIHSLSRETTLSKWFCIAS